MRTIIFISLCVISLGIVLKSYSSGPDDGYGWFPAVLGCSLLIILFWLPYWLVTPYLDGNKIIFLLNCILALTDITLLIFLALTKDTPEKFGNQFIILGFITLTLPIFFILSVINFCLNLKVN